jgi:hypothetical protein
LWPPRIRESKDKDFGFNAATESYENLVTAGVIDPTKVVRSALQNAASIAGLLLTTEALVSELAGREEAGRANAGPRHGLLSLVGRVGLTRPARLVLGSDLDGRQRATRRNSR